MRTKSASGALALAGVALLALLVGVAAAQLPARFAVIAAVAVFLPLLAPRLLVLAALTTICLLGLVRRLLSSGRIDYDPLLLVPLALLVAAVVFSSSKVTIRRTSLSEGVLVTLCLLPLASQIIVGAVGFAALYAVGLQVAAYATILWTYLGRLPDVGDVIYRAALPVGGVLGGYGIYQFFVLPTWDRNWMISSGLASIGQPIPGLVRVFGTSESPGSFALVLGLVAVAGLVRLTEIRGLRRALGLVSIGVISLALVLTGVRAALFGVVVALLYLAVKGRSPRYFVAVLSVGFAGVWLLSFALRTFGGADSSILNPERYSIGFSTDTSVQARLGLFDMIGPALTQPLGQGAAVEGATVRALDNLYVDVLVSFGPFALAALITLMLLVLRSALVVPARTGPENLAIGAVAVYGLSISLAGNLFATTTGLVLAILFGSILRRASALTASNADGGEPQKSDTWR